MKIRKAELAGSWYPRSASECEKQIRAFIRAVEDPPPSQKPLVGGIVPHAGWYFSGSIACNVIHRLSGAEQPDVFIVFGMHLHQGSSNYIMTEGAWETPFGAIEIESELAAALAKRFEFKIETPVRYTPDNTIELQLPFIKYFFNRVKLVPLGVPPVVGSLQIGKASVDICRQMGLCAKVLGSTDLTHYGGGYGFVPKGTGSTAVAWVMNENDRNVIDAMVAMDAQRVITEALTHQNACCAGAAAAAISAARQLGAHRAEKIAYATSYEKNPSDSFVGYAGIVFG